MNTKSNNPHPDNNVIAFPGSQLQDIAVASVHTSGTPLSGSRNKVWLCPAYSGAYEHMLYVKPGLTVRQIVAELLCAQVAIAMGLPCARPFLVAIAPHHIGEPRGKSMLAFGSEQVGTRSTAKVIRDLDIIFEALNKAKAAEGVSVLDEWSANSVRHERDMVFDARGTIWIIDHEAAIPPGLRPDEFVTNWLADRLRDRTDIAKRLELLQALRRKATKARTLHLGAVPPELQRIEGAAQHWKDVIEFLGVRLAELDRLLSQRMLPEQMYLPLEATEPLQNRDTDRTSQL